MNERIVYPENARNSRYRAELEEIETSDQCPFCPGGHTLTHLSQRVDFVHQDRSWLIKLNQYPLEGAEWHFTLILKAHKRRVGEMSILEAGDLLRVIDWLVVRYSVVGGVLYMRDGEGSLTGATVGNLHAQYVVPKVGEAVTARFGPPPKYKVVP